jgi:tRNA-2-methylthio-N6-dimethylallyladenosine synthase
MNHKSIHIKSFGCQMNKLDTALVRVSLTDAGYSLTDSVKEADVVLINTCSVRKHAEDRVLSHLGHLKHIKESRPELVVGVFGCMAQRMGAELLEHEAVDIVCGPAQIPQIKELVAQTLQQKKKTLAVTAKIRKRAESEDSQSLEEFECSYDRFDAQLPAQAYVRVMRGCDNFCSYCVVPYVRGPEVSRRPEVIIEQIKKLADEGVKLVTLLGQRVNAYKYESCGKKYSLADLLYLANEIEGIEWIRFVTSYPAEESYDDILDAMAGCEKACKYLHMPAQSGSDKILAAMNRKYNSAQYLEMIERAREKVTGIAIAGDFIVGFPGEMEEDFEASVSLLEKARYRNSFVFKYSPRPGTRGAEKLQDTVAQDVKRERNMGLLEVQQVISGELAGEFMGKTVKVLVEGLSKKAYKNEAQGLDMPQLTGRTEGDWIVVFNGPELLAGEFAEVKIIKTSPLTLFGELI